MTGAFNFEAAHVRVQQGTTEGLLDAAEVVKQEAIQRAPLDTGYLRNTAETKAEGNESAVGFDGDYAIVQHEAVGFHHQDGEAKYLENAVIAKQQEVAQVIAQAIRRSLS